MNESIRSFKDSKRSRTKSFIGCLSCKKKKKKCDETKPVCLRCKKGGGPCVWPDVMQRLGKVAKQNKATSGSERSLKDNVYRFNYDFTGSSIAATNIGKFNYFPALLLPDMRNIMIPGVSLSETDAICYRYFIEKFLPSLLHPFTHDSSVETIFLTASSQSQTLRNIFFACGATMISFENIFFKEVAHKKYIQAVKILIEEIKSGAILGSEDWLFMAVQTLQTLCFRENVVKLPAITVVPHFSAAFHIIRQKFKKISNKQWTETSRIIRPDPLSVSPKLYSSLDKALIENFLFNYPIAIFFGRSENLEVTVPDPFYVFNLANIWQDFSHESIYHNLNWYSQFAFETAAKSTWMCRLKLPLNDKDRSLCTTILSTASNVLKNFLTIDVSGLSNKVRQSVSIAMVTLRISLILIRKMLQMKELSAKDFQGEINLIINEIDKHENLILPGWTLLIGFCTSLEANQRNFFKNLFNKLLSNLNSNMLLQIINFVDSAAPVNTAPDYPFELLFDTQVLNMICL
ncbi:uncharacterized protein PRCAT00005770001 [Priceomyces carsonii]|uniref:uncharacterized protein n=1 Tax=Priceomyces carsonii TaxID=28549 RepID=UPI002ED968A6|nr:unnamed protein product [Priceomyces carsonii]